MNSILRKTGMLLIALLFVIISVSLPIGKVATAALADGEYTINYEILKGDPKDDSTSLANGYWNKPATVLIKDGNIKVRTVINQAAWVIEFATAQGNRFVDAKVISSNTEQNSRVVEFKVESLDKDLVSTMTVDIPEQNYYHSYEARFRFNVDSLTLVKADQQTSSDSKKATEEKVEATAVPQKTTEQATNKAAEATKSTTAPSNDANGVEVKDSIATKLEVQQAEATTDEVATDKVATEQVNTESSSASVLNEAVTDVAAEATELKNEDEPIDTTEQANELVTTTNEHEQVAEEMTSTLMTTIDAEQEKAGSTLLDDEVKRGGSNAFIIVVCIGVLFIAGFVIWYVSQHKRKQ